MRAEARRRRRLVERALRSLGYVRRPTPREWGPTLRFVALQRRRRELVVLLAWRVRVLARRA